MTKCEYCGNPLSAHPIRVEGKRFGVLTCGGPRNIAELLRAPTTETPDHG